MSTIKETDAITNIDFENELVLDKTIIDTESSLAALEGKYSLRPDANTVTGYQECKDGANEIQALRLAVEARRVALKEPHLTAGRIIQKQAVTIIQRLTALENPLRLAYRVVDDQQKALKAEKAAQLAKRLEVFTSAVAQAEGKSHAKIQEIINTIEGVDTETGFSTDKAKAIKAQTESLKRLNELLEMAGEREKNEAIAAAAEAQKRIDDKNKRIDDHISSIKLMPVDAFTLERSSEVGEMIDELESMPMGKSAYGDRSEDVKTAVNDSLVKLNKMFDKLVSDEQRAASELKEAQEKQAKIDAAQAEADKQARIDAEAFKNAEADKVEAETVEQAPEPAQEEPEAIEGELVEDEQLTGFDLFISEVDLAARSLCVERMFFLEYVIKDLIDSKTVNEKQLETAITNAVNLIYKGN